MLARTLHAVPFLNLFLYASILFAFVVSQADAGTSSKTSGVSLMKHVLHKIPRRNTSNDSSLVSRLSSRDFDRYLSGDGVAAYLDVTIYVGYFEICEAPSKFSFFFLGCINKADLHYLNNHI